MYSYQRFSAGTVPSLALGAANGVAEERSRYRTQGSTSDTEAIEQLGSSLRHHARRISMQTAVFIDMLARFDEQRGWRMEGARSCAHWLSWRCALGKVAASEHVRVARALKRLPLIRELFQRGDLSFSKVRAITRVADETNEDELIDMAASHAAHDLEQRVRQYRDARSADAVKKEHQRAQWQYAHRSLNYHWREDGCLQLHARLTPEQGALFLKALEVAEAEIGFERYDCRADTGEPPVSPDDIPVRKPGQRRVDALCLMVNSHLTAASDGRSSDRFQVVVNVDLDTLETDGAGTSQLDPGPAIAAETARRLSCDCSLVHMLSSAGEPLAIGRKSPVIPGAMRRALLFRDEHRCQFPGCAATHGLQGHHVHHWAQGGNTDLDNLVTLCPFHHRLLHEGGYRIEPNPDWQKPGAAASVERSVIQAESCRALQQREAGCDEDSRGNTGREKGQSPVPEVSRGKLSGCCQGADAHAAASQSDTETTLYGRPRPVPRFLFFDLQRLRIGAVGSPVGRVWRTR